jgi:hypothetical protein
MTASEDAHISAELEAWVRRVTASPGHAALAVAYESGEAETLPAAHRGPEPASQSLLRHLQHSRRHSQRSPDRQRSDERRRRLAWSGSLPGYLAGGFTISNMAVARVVADEHRSHHIMAAWQLRSQIDGRSEVHPDWKSSRWHRAWRKHQAHADADRFSAATSLVEGGQGARLSDPSPPSSSWTGTGGATGSEMQGFAVRGSISGLQRSAHQQRKVSRCQS